MILQSDGPTPLSVVVVSSCNRLWNVRFVFSPHIFGSVADPPFFVISWGTKITALCSRLSATKNTWRWKLARRNGARSGMPSFVIASVTWKKQANGVVCCSGVCSFWGGEATPVITLGFLLFMDIPNDPNQQGRETKIIFSKVQYHISLLICPHLHTLVFWFMFTPPKNRLKTWRFATDSVSITRCKKIRGMNVLERKHAEALTSDVFFLFEKAMSRRCQGYGFWIFVSTLLFFKYFFGFGKMNEAWWWINRGI